MNQGDNRTLKNDPFCDDVKTTLVRPKQDLGVDSIIKRRRALGDIGNIKQQRPGLSDDSQEQALTLFSKIEGF